MSESIAEMMAYNRRCNAEPAEPQVDKVPSKWMAIWSGTAKRRSILS